MNATVTVSRQQEVETFAKQLASDNSFEQKTYAVTSTWASKLGHPCGERWLYYLRTDWEQMTQRDWKGIGILGNLIHDWWRIHMMQKGYAITQNEEPLSEELRRKFGIGGRVDGRIGKAGRGVYYEFKSMDEHTYGKINSVEDMYESDKAYLRAYPAQLQIYLYDKNEEFGFFILCNKKTLEWKIIVVPLDLAYVESLLKKAEEVKKAYDAKLEENPFPRISYGSTCKGCEFAHLCMPDIRNEGLDFIDHELLEAMLAERASLEDHVRQYDKLDKEAKDIAKGIGRDFVVGDSYAVRIKKTSSKRIDTKLIPAEIAKQFFVPSERTTVEFVPLDAPKL